MWMSSSDSIPAEKDPEQYVWKLDREIYRIVGFEGDTSPRALDIVCEHEETQTHDNRYAATDDGILEKLFWFHLPG